MGRDPAKVARYNRDKAAKRRIPADVKAANEEARRLERKEEDERRLDLLTLVAEADGTRADLADLIGITEEAVRRWAIRRGISQSPMWLRIATGKKWGERIGMVISDPTLAEKRRTRAERAADRIEDIEWLVKVGKANDVEIADRTGVSINTLERFLYRHGRGDLWAQMSDYRRYSYDKNLQEVG